MKAIEKIIVDLEKAFLRPVVVIGNGFRGARCVDFDEFDAREMAPSFSGEKAPLIIALGRGGEPSFDGQLLAMLSSFDVIVLGVAAGWVTRLCAASQRVLLTPSSGIGAFDERPVTGRIEEVDAWNFDDIPALGGIQSSPRLLQALAGGRAHRRACRLAFERYLRRGGYPQDTVDEILYQMSADRLGKATGLNLGELQELGLRVEVVENELLQELKVLLEDLLGLRSPIPPAYTKSDLGDEAQFEPAVGLTAAVWADSRGYQHFELDTGRVDPDSGRLMGGWCAFESW